jgi:leucyl-tRNA synthetase
VLYDLGFVSTPEPFGRLFNQGYILADAFVDERGFYVPAEKVEMRDGVYLYEGKEVERRTGSMGKSRKNSITPDEFIHVHGADTLRVYEMFMGPLDSSKPWTTRDVVGVERFLQRVWRNYVDPESGEVTVSDDPAPDELRRLLHRTIRTVTNDMESLRFNTAVARFFELNNELVGLSRLPAEVADAFIRLIAPMAPHIAEELWERMGKKGSIAYADWPSYDEALAAAETVTMVVQVDGKVRDRIEVDPDISEEEARTAALASSRVAEHLDRDPSRVIVLPPNLVSIVSE